MARSGREYDYDKIIQSFKEGHTFEEIKEEIGCSIATVRRVLHDAGIIAKTPQIRTVVETECPITREELEKTRRGIRIGDRFFVDADPEEEYSKAEEYTVVAKYRHFCILKNRKGVEKCKTYADLALLLREGASNEK